MRIFPDGDEDALMWVVVSGLICVFLFRLFLLALPFILGVGAVLLYQWMWP